MGLAPVAFVMSVFVAFDLAKKELSQSPSKNKVWLIIMCLQVAQLSRSLLALLRQQSLFILVRELRANLIGKVKCLCVNLESYHTRECHPFVFVQIHYTISTTNLYKQQISTNIPALIMFLYQITAISVSVIDDDLYSHLSYHYHKFIPNHQASFLPSDAGILTSPSHSIPFITVYVKVAVGASLTALAFLW